MRQEKLIFNYGRIIDHSRSPKSDQLFSKP
jgi:hypothetical protein